MRRVAVPGRVRCHVDAVHTHPAAFELRDVPAAEVATRVCRTTTEPGSGVQVRVHSRSRAIALLIEAQPNHSAGARKRDLVRAGIQVVKQVRPRTHLDPEGVPDVESPGKRTYLWC
jgi:hypothetical protein